ncbi:MAG: glycosyltransferase family 4 protein [Myxococcales bacterium]|nr:glycosyltransferase family 4 protein [Myxococcales bacterium]
MADDASRAPGRREPLRVLYVYHGTAGVAGAYLAGIASALASVESVDLRMATNHYFAFARGRGKRLLPVFFALTENTDRNPFLRVLELSRLRLPLRYAELALGYLRLVPYVVRERIEVVNLSVIDDELPTWLFALTVKALGRTLLVTAHDVVFEGPRSSASRRRRVFGLADRLVVHFDHVRDELQRRMGIPRESIHVHPFPWAEVETVLDSERLRRHEAAFRTELREYDRIFLLLGVLRKEKGIETLLDAWSRAKFPPGMRCGLLIAGKGTACFDRARANRLPNVVVVDHYLTPEEFWAALATSHVVVLPYRVRWYAHSSVALMAFLAQKAVVASDIPLFRALVDSESGLLHGAGNADDLARALERCAVLGETELCRLGQAGRRKLVANWSVLPVSLRALYDGATVSRRQASWSASSRNRANS